MPQLSLLRLVANGWDADTQLNIGTLFKTSKTSFASDLSVQSIGYGDPGIGPGKRLLGQVRLFMPFPFVL